eukprot:augustus_masked-scaffold_13-processed-gene-11.69-mRNA-1 protein AED:1.00 eAED:1.00 QI:0/-1/0/0/-1/1/1/0/606
MSVEEPIQIEPTTPHSQYLGGYLTLTTYQSHFSFKDELKELKLEEELKAPFTPIPATETALSYSSSHLVKLNLKTGETDLIDFETESLRFLLSSRDLPGLIVLVRKFGSIALFSQNTATKFLSPPRFEQGGKGCREVLFSCIGMNCVCLVEKFDTYQRLRLIDLAVGDSKLELKNQAVLDLSEIVGFEDGIIHAFHWSQERNTFEFVVQSNLVRIKVKKDSKLVQLLDKEIIPLTKFPIRKAYFLEEFLILSVKRSKIDIYTFGKGSEVTFYKRYECTQPSGKKRFIIGTSSFTGKDLFVCTTRNKLFKIPLPVQEKKEEQIEPKLNFVGTQVLDFSNLITLKRKLPSSTIGKIKRLKKEDFVLEKDGDRKQQIEEILKEWKEKEADQAALTEELKTKHKKVVIFILDKLLLEKTTLIDKFALLTSTVELFDRQRLAPSNIMHFVEEEGEYDEAFLQVVLKTYRLDSSAFFTLVNVALRAGDYGDDRLVRLFSTQKEKLQLSLSVIKQSFDRMSEDEFHIVVKVVLGLAEEGNAMGFYWADRLLAFSLTKHIEVAADDIEKLEELVRAKQIKSLEDRHQLLKSKRNGAKKQALEKQNGSSTEILTF